MVALAGSSTRTRRRPAVASRLFTRVGATGTFTWKVAVVPLVMETVSRTVRRRLAKLKLRRQLVTASVLQNAGVDADRVYQVSGKAGSDPLYPDDPSLAGNRRIAIVLLREAPVLPTDTSL